MLGKDGDTLSMNPFEVLELRSGATEQEIRAAYRRLVKRCHPDQFQDNEMQKTAQDALIQLNLAYEEALRLSAQPNIGYNLISLEEAKHFSLRLLEQDKPEAALRQLARAESKDAEWYFIQGEIMMRLNQYETAHQSYREAVRREPDNRRYHARALDAAVALKNSQKLGNKLSSWVKEIVGRR